MRLYITLSPREPVVLPIHYNYILQSAIYSNLGSELGTLMHDEGYEHGSRAFKPLTFSRLNGTYSLDDASGRISFNGPIGLVVSSPIEEVCHSLGTRLLLKGSIELAGQQVLVDSVEARIPVVLSNVMTVTTLSPVVVYSTLTKADGSRYTCYFQPGESEFERLVSGNLVKKSKAILGVDPPDGTISVQPLRQPRLHIVYYKDTVIKAYSGRLRLEGPKELILLALDAGLGSKNAQGFGCLEAIGHYVESN
ncbi:MAG TPA: CRISPR-associated endoribonuclease Cas6 [Bacillota bacterium]|nr:CRISPR-associated endoribonuclease Cas6 [Bacillota bacterium]